MTRSTVLMDMAQELCFVRPEDVTSARGMSFFLTPYVHVCFAIWEDKVFLDALCMLVGLLERQITAATTKQHPNC